MSSSRINYTPTLSNRNVLINGNFLVWQRGTTGSNPTSNATSYCADRWSVYRGAFTSGISWSQITPGYDNFLYGLRVTRTDGDTAVNTMNLRQAVETINSYSFRGQTATLSFWARKGSGYSQASSTLTSSFGYGTGTNQAPTGSITGYANAASSAVTLTTTWQKFTITGEVSSTATQLFVTFQYTPAGTAASDYFEISGVQLEIGPTATPFENRSYQQELALCQSYYWRWTPNAIGDRLGSGSNNNTTNAAVNVHHPVTMRTVPSGGASATAGFYSVAHAGTATTCSAVPTFSALNVQTALVTLTVASGLTAGQGAMIRSASTAGYIEFSAEL